MKKKMDSHLTSEMVNSRLPVIGQEHETGKGGLRGLTSFSLKKAASFSIHDAGGERNWSLTIIYG